MHHTQLCVGAFAFKTPGTEAGILLLGVIQPFNGHRDHVAHVRPAYRTLRAALELVLQFRIAMHQRPDAPTRSLEALRMRERLQIFLQKPGWDLASHELYHPLLHSYHTNDFSFSNRNGWRQASC